MCYDLLPTATRIVICKQVDGADDHTRHWPVRAATGPADISAPIGASTSHTSHTVRARRRSHTRASDPRKAEARVQKVCCRQRLVEWLTVEREPWAFDSHTFTGSPRTREELLEATTRTCVEPASLRCTARGAGVASRARISRGGRISSFRASGAWRPRAYEAPGVAEGTGAHPHTTWWSASENLSSTLEDSFSGTTRTRLGQRGASRGDIITAAARPWSENDRMVGALT